MAARHHRFGGWALIVLGGLLVLIGLFIAAGGTWLASVGRSYYYLLAGIALVGGGVLLMRQGSEDSA